ncbi:MAG: hypothetical protein AB3N18_04610 [Allomuricauda sp.]
MPIKQKPKEVVLSLKDWELINSQYEAMEEQIVEIKKNLARKTLLLDAVKRAGVIIDPSVLHDGPLEIVVDTEEKGKITRVVVKADV